MYFKPAVATSLGQALYPCAISDEVWLKHILGGGVSNYLTPIPKTQIILFRNFAPHSRFSLQDFWILETFH